MLSNAIKKMKQEALFKDKQRRKGMDSDVFCKIVSLNSELVERDEAKLDSLLLRFSCNIKVK